MDNRKSALSLGDGRAPGGQFVPQNDFQQRDQPFLQGELVEVDILRLPGLVELVRAGLGNPPVAPQFILEAEPFFNPVIGCFLLRQFQTASLFQQCRGEQAAF